MSYNNLKDYLQREDSTQDTVPGFIDHMLGKIEENKKKWYGSLIIALTKKSSEEIANFMLSKGYKTFYLHSEVDTIDRWEIIKKLKSWEIDVLVGVNLLREGIDLPEVGFIAILDADKEGFLRSTTALVQNIWRSARNPQSEVVLYADKRTASMTKSLRETYRRRGIQEVHNKEHGIIPTQAISNVKSLESVRTDEEHRQHEDYKLIRAGKAKKLKRMTKKEKALIADNLRASLDTAIKERRFEDAAIIRDQLEELHEG